MPAAPDVLIVGSGIGGATLAAGLAGSGARVTILERGAQLPDSPAARDAKAIFGDGHYRPDETWRDGQGAAFNPGNYYCVGGNSKFYGAVMLRYREQDFQALEHEGGVSPAWPFPYATLEPWYGRAERLFQVRGALGQDPSEPEHATPYDHPPVPDEPAIAAVRERLAAQGLHPFSLPLAVDIERWLRRAATPWDAYPDTRSGKLDAETAALATALRSPDVTLVTGAQVRRLLLARDGRRVEGVEYDQDGERRVLRAATVVLAAGAVNSAALPPALRQPRQPLGRGRPLLHEPQLHGDARGRPARRPTIRSTRRRSASTTSTSTTARAARRWATSSCWARSPHPCSAPTCPGRPASPCPGSPGTASTGT